MPKFIFWNITGKPVQELIVSIARSNDADVLILAECELDPNELVVALNQHSPDYQYAPGFCEALLFFTKFDSRFLTPVSENSRISIRRLRLPARKELIIAGAHLPSKLQFKDESQIFQCTELAKMIGDEEANADHRRTILLGDLNVNPFEVGVIASGGLHAVTTRDVALKGKRVVQGREYAFFYNPMWKYFGDRNDGTPGTYYYEKAESVNYFWNTFDQILIRPELLDGFNIDGVRVLTQAGGIPLVDRLGRPDKKNSSDHLPVFLSIEF